ncbi:MAG: zf-TFIIB domain-containing protein [Candidatus Pacebacteria bacterium]|nr:zf-TFIIB domain-containing protein [Candidatus Paceibacterota bacterium]
MNCPTCKDVQLENSIFHDVEIDFCPQCLGIWFEMDEFDQAKNKKDKNLNWLDIDLWKDEKMFTLVVDQKACPLCEVPLYVVEYGKSKIQVDICNLCGSIWLDRGEFAKIIDYLKKEKNHQILYHYTKNLLTEGAEIFWGPEDFSSEVKDFVTILKMLSYKLGIQHPKLTELVSALPK